MKVFVPFLVVFILLGCKSKTKQHNSTPNIIVVYTDDQGYQDLTCYGSPKIQTPNIDKMASEGLRFTDFYVASSVCSPSRASILTGKLPINNGVPHVFFQDEKGMDSTQVTLAEVLKRANYRTACFGKWHLGDLDGHLPTDQGFDEYYGIPFSNDMSIGSSHEFAENVVFNEGYSLEKAKEDQLLVKADQDAGKKAWEQGRRNKVPIFEGDKIVEYPAEQSSLTKRYFNRTIDFIQQSEGEPFFIYLTPAMPHVPLYASETFKGKSEGGIYGDVIEEIDYYMGQLLRYLKESGLDKNTLVIYASDNGPWLEMNEAGGSAKPFRGGKFSNYEGGVRVPGIFWYPGKIEANTISKQITSTVDILPTVAALANIDISDIAVDGYVLPELIEGSADTNRIHLYSQGADIWGIRVGDWKYLPFSGKKWATKEDEAELFYLKDDIGEENNLMMTHPEKAQELSKLLHEFEQVE